jgi:energy-coupling factor transporter ATP-binding protein EcfA2
MNDKGASFLVGIDEYEDPYLSNFSKSISGRDVDSISNLLREPASQFNPPSEEFKLSNKKVTYKELETQLSNFLKIKEYTRVLIYFSGHGYQVWDRDSKIIKGYLATSNSQISIFKDEDDDKKFINQNNGLAFISIARLIAAATHLKRLVLLIDSCHSGQAITTKELQNSLLELSQNSSDKAEEDNFRYCIIASSLSSEKSFTQDNLGFFTKTLIEQLGSKEGGSITAEQLINRLTLNFQSRHQQLLKPYNSGSILLMDYPSIESKEPIVDPIRNEDGEVICPYRGLSYFDNDEQHQKFFFGREFDIQKIRERLQEVAFVPVIGASGSGKSSLVRAGLLQKELLQKEEGVWHIEIIKPEEQPLWRFLDALRNFRDTIKRNSDGYKLIDNYINRLRPVDFTPESFDVILEALRGDKKYLLVIDQFEEVFTLASSATTVFLQDQSKEVHDSESGDRANLRTQERDCFLELVTRVARVKDSPLKVVVTLRADFLGKCLTHPALKNLIEKNVVLVAPLIGRGLVDAIEKPAAAQGYPLDPELVDALVRDSGNQPGFLPLLEFTLERLWQKRVEEPKPHISLDAYEEPGNQQTKTGLKQALNLHANQVYEFADFYKDEPLLKRSEEERAWIRLIFLRLLTTGQGNTDTRFPQALSGLLSISDPSHQLSLETVIESLIRGRLLVTYENQSQQKMLDLAHEALIEGWDEFKDWRVKGGEIRRIAERLVQSWRDWDKATAKDKTQYLISRALLAQVRENWSQLKLYFGDFEKEIREFFYLSNRHERAEKLELQLQVDAAQIERKITAKKTAQEVLTAAIQMIGTNREHFPNRLIGAVPASLRQAVENCFTTPLPYGHSSSVLTVAFSPDGRSIVYGSNDNTVRLWNLDGTPIGQPFEGHSSSVFSVSFIPT